MGIFDETLAGFSSAISRLTSGDTGRICLAVSGGPDSLAMLLLAQCVVPERIVAVTVNHGLRSEAAAEADFVAALCARLGVPHAVLSPEIPISGNIQSEARKVRYALLQNYAAAQDCSWIATAHHADDQIETFLMRLARGSGVDGLAGIRAVNGNIIRPLLGFPKSDLEAICADAGIVAIDDPSNDNIEFDRVRIRKWLAAHTLPFERDAAGKSALALADASDALDWVIAEMAEKHVRHLDGEVQVSAQSLPVELQRRLMLSAIDFLQPGYQPRGDALSRTLEMLAAGEKAMLGDCIIEAGEIWKLYRAPPRRGKK